MTDIIPEVWKSQTHNERIINGRICGLQKFLFTTGLLTDLTFSGLIYNYSARYCYEHFEDALEALNAWDGEGDPPGNWIKEKVSERLGAGATA
ncbi:MAG: hypothetical protein LBE24_04225 [Methylobacillus sp.]|jgi:hypothetical protein|nr:hypothetical protein [Methylobacillus sp.]